MDKQNGVLTLVGRIFLSLIFLSSGMGKIFDFQGTTGYMEAHGMPMTSLFLVGAIIFELVGAALIITGFKTRIGAVMLIVFLIPATFIFHQFWTIEDPMQWKMQMIMFMKNVSIFGGLLAILGSGAGPISIDGRKSSD